MNIFFVNLYVNLYNQLEQFRSDNFIVILVNILKYFIIGCINLIGNRFDLWLKIMHTNITGYKVN